MAGSGSTPSGCSTARPGLSWWTLAPAAALGLLVLVAVLAVGGYVVANWGFVLSHANGAWHLRRGLLTTRETSLDDERLAGVSVSEPLALRLAGGGRVSAIVTGLGRRQQGSALLVPPAPRPVVLRVAGIVLGDLRAGARVPWPGTGPARTGAGSRGPWRRRSSLLAATLLLVLLADAPAWLLHWRPLGIPVGRGPRGRPGPAGWATPSSTATWSPAPAASTGTGTRWPPRTSSAGPSGPAGSSGAPA